MLQNVLNTILWIAFGLIVPAFCLMIFVSLRTQWRNGQVAERWRLLIVVVFISSAFVAATIPRLSFFWVVPYGCAFALIASDPRTYVKDESVDE